jgi:hypothetical protein
MPPLERARTHVTIARAAALLARLGLRLRGEVLEEGHPLAMEQVGRERGGSHGARGVGRSGWVPQGAASAVLGCEECSSLSPLPQPRPAPASRRPPPLRPSLPARRRPPPQERLRRYEGKLLRAGTADELARSRPGTELNLAAANRFITAAIPDLTPAQRAALRGAGEAGQDGGGGGGGGGGRQQQRSGGGKRVGEVRGGGGGKRGKRGGEGGGGESGGGGGKGAELDDILAAAAGGGEGAA